MNALPSPSCGYLPARAMRQAPGLRSVISVVRGQAFGHTHGPERHCSRSSLRRNGPSNRLRVSPLPLECRAHPPWHRSAAAKCAHRDLPSGRKLPGSRPARGASACRGSAGVSDSTTLAGRRDSRFPAATACAVAFRSGRFRTGFPLRPKPLRSPSDPAGCVASYARFQSRCTGG